VAASRRDGDRCERGELLGTPEGFRFDPALLPHLDDGGDVAHLGSLGTGDGGDCEHHGARVAEGGAEVDLSYPALLTIHLAEDQVLEVPGLVRREEAPEDRAGQDGGVDAGEVGESAVHGEDSAILPQEDHPDRRALEIFAQGFAETGGLGQRRRQRLSNRSHLRRDPPREPGTQPIQGLIVARGGLLQPFSGRVWTPSARAVIFPCDIASGRGTTGRGTK